MEDKFSTLFPYDEPRESQADGISRIDDAIGNSAIVTMEGACGTGKTLTALTPAIHHIRDSDSDVSRALCVTSVKQQMRAFQDEIRRINNSLPDGTSPVSAVTLVGVSDLHPYIRMNLLDESGYDGINRLRERTRKLATEEIHDYTYTQLYQRARDPQSNLPYGEEIPTADGLEYDPYYAKYRSEYNPEEENSQEVLPFDTESIGLLTADRLVDVAGSRGYCPHSLMRLAIEHTDVIIGNYTHAFDPRTVERVSAPAIDEETVAILDEAHNLVSRVRQFLSVSQSLSSIQRAQKEITEIIFLLRLAEMNDESVQSVQNSLRTEGGLTSNSEEVSNLSETYEEIVTTSASVVSNSKSLVNQSQDTEKIADKVGLDISQLRKYNELLSGIESVINKLVDRNKPLYDEDSIPLREPENPSADTITNWVDLSEYQDIIQNSAKIGGGCLAIRSEISETLDQPKTSANAVSDLLSKWYSRDNTRYYRSIQMYERKKQSSYGRFEWQRDLRAELTIQNCIPRQEISTLLDKFHSSVLMSATLDPMDVYHQTTGISDLEDREIEVLRYGLSFPKDNRITLGVRSDKFSYQNRGQTFNNGKPNTSNKTRKQYRDLIFDVVQNTEGSVLVVMPSYPEAEWIGTLLKNSYMCSSSDIFIDESSSDRETEELKNAFFSKDNSVLVTGAAGTLIEGVDYIGDRLVTAVVCGVPITNTQSNYKKAIQAAYDKIFDDFDGFTLAFTIPAVWKTRQAIGRVVRTDSDVGARILADRRYTERNGWDTVGEYLGDTEKNEIKYVDPDDLDIRLKSFWKVVNSA